MEIDLDRIARAARRAIDEHQEHPFWPYRHSCTPFEAIAMVERITSLEKAVRLLYDAWADAEGCGQPERAVFGPDEGMRRWLIENEEPFREAPPDVQAVVRECVK
jgi:hypothetical protein